MSARDAALARISKLAQRRLLPLLLIGYMLAILDRGNISFAALGMNADLGLTATDYGWASGVFFAGYLLFEIPSNLMLHRFGARIWISRIMISWGAVCMMMALSWSAMSLGVFRFLLGVAEAGFLPGILLYLTYWFPKEHRFKITSGFIVAIPVMSALSALASSSLLQLDGLLGLRGWQWLFLIEGVPALLLGLIIFAILPDRPQQVTWLSDGEKQLLQQTLNETDTAPAVSNSAAVKLAVRNAVYWGLGFVNFGIIICNYAISYWLPQIVHGFGFKPVEIGFLVAAPHAAGVIGILIWGRVCHGRPLQLWMLAIPMVCATAGMILGALTLNSSWTVIGFFSLAGLGLYASIPAFWTIASSVTSGRAAAAGIAFINTIGSFSGLLGPTLMGYLKDRTHDHSAGLLATTGFLVAATVLAVVLAPRLFQTQRI